MADTSKSNSNTNSTWQKCFDGIPIRDGYAVGPVQKHITSLPVSENKSTTQPDLEIKRFNEALESAHQDLKELVEQLNTEDEQQKIFQAHILMIQDPVLKKNVINRIKKEFVTAESAWLSVMHDFQQMWEKAGKGSSMENRSSDIVDVGIRVLRILQNETIIVPKYDQKVILVTKELTASDAMSLDSSHFLAVLSERGNDTSHSAILIRSRGIPAVFGLKDIVENTSEEQILAVDAINGKVYTGCSESFITDFQVNIEDFEQYQSDQSKDINSETKLPSGEKVSLLANVSSVDQIESALKHGASGVGLFRTEFLYTNRSTPPSLSDQIEIYKKAISLMDGRKIVFRTGDFGGDKPIPYLKFPKEDNPFLGLRGIRFSMREMQLLDVQLKALLTASEIGSVSIMFPMVSTVDEVHQILDLVHEIRIELELNGIKVGKIDLGVMIEVPSAAIQIKEILELVDFVSIGTNDLIQYVMAADRTQTELTSIVSGFQPSALRLVKYVIECANEANKSVSICGELAGDHRFTGLLVAFGLREFSMSADRIPAIKHEISIAHTDLISKLLTGLDTCKTANHVKILLERSGSV
ncbi:MAG TPA: phosphoenolpyruvate--protein phosphotransferase [Bacteroidetes bacterium]|nr:phosphoenolpyruvate--protein phosphotransferase [Bacteroidota bacterium]